MKALFVIFLFNSYLLTNVYADSTRLLEVDFVTGKKRKIDPTKRKSRLDAELDSLLDSKLGSTEGFSTKELEKVPE